ncbi:MAG: ABC transporter permease subunit [Kiritimatiellae bacterium]|nr:ABC transporter permease subunit [Kiritimatiellia bacterium]
MLRLLIRKEILAHVLSLRFTVTFMLFLIMVFAGIYVSVGEHNLETRRHGSRDRAYRHKLDDILKEPRDWGAHGRLERLFWMEGKSDAAPPAELSWLGQGLQSVMPVGARVTEDRSEPLGRGLARNPLLGLLSAPDFIYMVNVVLSLLAILFMFDAVCGEKETGTLRLMLSNSVPRHTVLLGKWIGGYICLSLPFLVATAGGIGYAWVRGAWTPSAESAIRIVALVLLACLYIAVFFNVSLFISTVTHSAATSLLVCLLVWVVFTLAVPNMAPVTAKIVEPTPAPQKIQAEKRAIDEEIEIRMDRLKLTTGQLQYGDAMEKAREKLERERRQRHRQWDAFYERACQRQMNLAQTLGRLSPSASWVYAATELSGTGPRAYERLVTAMRRMGEEFGDFVQKYFKAGTEPGGRDWPRIRPDQLPALKVARGDALTDIGAVMGDVSLLVVECVVFFMLGFVRFLRYDAR